jgi:group I intron endonuclease
MIGIYAIKNIKNNKYYIGQSLHVERRWIEHKSELNNNRHTNRHLQFSWNKNGSEQFEFILLEECLLEELDTKEKYWIREFNSYEGGYNLDSGGQGIESYKHTEEEIDKMRRIQNPMCILQFDLNRT